MVFSTEPHSDACPSDRERGLSKHDPRGHNQQNVGCSQLSVPTSGALPC